MTDMNLNNSQRLEAHGLMGDMETALDAMRVIHDIMIDQVCGHTPSDAADSMRHNERMCVLLGSLKNKLGEAEKIRDKVAETLFNAPAQTHLAEATLKH